MLTWALFLPTSKVGTMVFTQCPDRDGMMKKSWYIRVEHICDEVES